MFGVVLDAPIVDDHFHFSEALEVFAISSFDPELFTGSGLLKGHLICQVQH